MPVLRAEETPPMVLRLRPAVSLSDDQFFEVRQQNRHLRLERTVQGDVVIRPLPGEIARSRSAHIRMQLGLWAERDDSGVAFDATGGFILPNGAMRSPDAAWIKRSRLAGLTPEQKEKFISLCPDFVVESGMASDARSLIREKMWEYIENGAQLGFLLDPATRKVYVYRPDTPVELFNQPDEISGDPALPGFVLKLQEIWEPNF